MSRVLLLGLDCLAPQLVFDRWPDQLPALRSLMTQGGYGPLRSCVPPITVPAWSCMLSSKDPGQLGIYGFRNRKDHGYDGMAVATSRHVKHERVWDILARAGKHSIVIGVPGTYPPPRVERTLFVADFLTPDKQAEYTWPPELRSMVDSVAPEYRFDVEEFRTDDKRKILDQIFCMTTDRFSVARALAKQQPWDFLMLHEIGPDRIHHGFWAAMDPEHARYRAGNPYEHCILDYYRHLDAEIDLLLQDMPEDVHVLVASDHGAKVMKGGVCINEWLLREGYLTLKSQPEHGMPLSQAGVDWERTRAWGEGGYYARVFFNLAGREPLGALKPQAYDTFAEELRGKLLQLPDHLGRPMATCVYRPDEIYRELQGVAPDLTVLFDDLSWRSVGTVGSGQVYTFDNDTGPDDANHAMDGLIILRTTDGGTTKSLTGASLYDVAPTVLELLGIKPPADMIGRSLVDVTCC